MFIAGPCGIESSEQAFKIAEFVKSKGATVFRAGCYKGMNRPVVDGKPEYLGMGDKGVEILSDIQYTLDIPCLTDMQSVRQAEVLHKYGIAYPQVGARNMDSLELLRQFKKIFNKSKAKAIVLKRGPSATVDEWLGAAEHLGGPERVILCERGIVSFDRTKDTRWRLDMVGVAYIKEYTQYRIIVDPSHGSGDHNLIYRLSAAALAIADGLMIEVHPYPLTSPTDGKQTIDFTEFTRVANLVLKKKLGPKLAKLDQDVERMTGVTAFWGIDYALQIEKRLGLPPGTITNLKLTTTRFADFLQDEANNITKINNKLDDLGLLY